MLFNSLEFAVFLVAVLIGHFWLIPRRAVRGRKIFLLAASYLFYAAWNPFFSLLLAFSTAVDYSMGLALAGAASSAKRRLYVTTSLVANLGLLGFYKYGFFVTESAYTLAGRTLEQGELPWLEVALPVGISFYTFQSLSYTLDVYRRVQAPTRSLLDFALYVSFFPQLVAGPIVRAKELLEQLAGPRTSTPEDFEAGLARVVTGLVKKVLLADTIGVFVDAVFDDPGAYGGIEIALAIYGFAFQIFFDFAGYCDIAIGVARMLGVRLPENFDRPYRSLNVQEFWRRWHITLSTWLRDYLYISLGGNRKGAARTLANLFTTMLLGGLWHGAGWGFVLWGAYHGALLGIHRVWRGPNARPPRLPAWLRVVATFHLVCVGWILFRSPTLEAAGELVSRLGSTEFYGGLAFVQAAVALGIAAVVHLATGSRQLTDWLVARSAWLQGFVYAGVAWALYFMSGRTGEFIYFQF
jgi:D-alanyl-lipoteichoic acid acyltransferase DltB (MBOAT superfamily)